MFSSSEWPQIDMSDDGNSIEDEASGKDPFRDDFLDMCNSTLVGDGGSDGVDSIPDGTFYLNYEII